MKRIYYKESFIALATILFFDFLRLFYVINLGISNIFDYLWIILLILTVLFIYISNKNLKYVSILTIVSGFLPLLFVLLNTIQIGSTGQIFDFNYFFMLFETLLITGINISYLYEIIKFNKNNNKDSTNNE